MSLTPELCEQLQDTLLRTGLFETDRDLASVFIDERISTLQHSIPQTNNPKSRVWQTLKFLHGRNNSADENALVLFLRIASERFDKGDSLHGKLIDLAEKVERVAKTQGAIEYEPKDMELLESIASHLSNRASLERIYLEHNYVVSAEEFLRNPKDFLKELIYFAKFSHTLDLVAHTLLKELHTYSDEASLAALVRFWLKWGGRISDHVKVVVVVAANLFGRAWEFLDELAGLLEIDPSQIRILKLASGSTHLLISLPQNSARFLVNNPIAQINDNHVINDARLFETLDNVERDAWHLAPMYEPYRKTESNKPIAWETLMHKARISPSSLESRIISRRGKADLILPDNRPKSFRCSLGLHDLLWDETTCQQTGQCTRCGSQKKRTKHQWSGWLPDAKNNCRLTRVCERYGCKSLETSYEDLHSWSQWSYLAEGKCDVQHVCFMCGSVGYDKHHKWERREYVSKTGVDCKIEYICIRCRDKTTSPDGHSPTEEHQWGPPERTPDGKSSIVRCKRCGKLKAD